MSPRVGLLCGGLSPRTGTGEYARTLVRHLPEVAPELEFVALARPPFSETLPRDGCEMLTLPARGPLSRVLAELFRSPAPNLALVHALALSFPPQLPAPLVVTLHDLCMWKAASTLSFARRHYLRWATHRCMRHARAIIVDSEAVADEAREMFPGAAERLSVVPLGVDVPAISREAGNHILLVGADDPRKGADLLAQAYALCAARQPMPDLVLVGRAGHETRTACGKGWIVRRGAVDDASLHALVAGARLLVSASEYEGYDLPPHHALAAGVPVLLSDIAVHREIYGADATCFKAGDILDLGSKLRECLERTDIAPERRDAWRAKDGRRMATAIAAIYASLLTANY